MKYNSTRGSHSNLSFSQVLFSGLADDGGLFVPEHIPLISDLAHLRSLKFSDLCAHICSLYIGDEISFADLQKITKISFANFRHELKCPVVQIGSDFVCELFHGPTFAFKDFALQMLGTLLEHFLEKRAISTTVLGATSGDTGSAAIYGLRGKKYLEVFMLHPDGRLSETQKRQMTTVLDSNVHNIAVGGTFDDGQAIVKALFRDLDFKRKHNLVAVNSINWARIMVQIVYYFSAYFQVVEKVGNPICFSVPTGNFGDVLAGYYARAMGLPIEKLCIATNENDILHRFVQTGVYSMAESVTQTLAPAMDIQIASNFERYLYHLCNDNAEILCEWMNEFAETGQISSKAEYRERVLADFHTTSIHRSEVISTIKSINDRYSYVLDPHSAIGYAAMVRLRENSSEKWVSMCTASPGKFADAILEATGENHVPDELACLSYKPSHCVSIPADTDKIKKYIEKTVEPFSPKKFVIRVPASSGNLGPGYDVLGMALGLYLTITVDTVIPSSAMGPYNVTFIGEGQEEVGFEKETNLLLNAAITTAHTHGMDFPKDIHIRIENAIPFGRGLGSSAAAVVGGVLLAVHACGLPSDSILIDCLAIENHPDNITAQLQGGTVTCYVDQGPKWLNIDTHSSIRAVVVIPEFHVSTNDARKVVPDSFSKENVIYNLQHVAGLVAGLSTASPALRTLMQDCVHQPARAALVPGLNDILNLECIEGLLGTALSGSGPTVLCLAVSNFISIGEAVCGIYSKHGIKSRFMVLDIDHCGARLLSPYET